MWSLYIFSAIIFDIISIKWDQLENSTTLNEQQFIDGLVQITLFFNIMTFSQRFYSEMSLVIDQWKQNEGNSNDGKTLRCFSSNPSIVSEITGINEELLEWYGNILTFISREHYIKGDIFQQYCFRRPKLAVFLYSWHKLRPSVHKLLIHGADTKRSLPSPLGHSSNGAIKTGHKQYKRLTQYYSRETSWINTNWSIFYCLLVKSDPIVTNICENLGKTELLTTK